MEGDEADVCGKALTSNLACTHGSQYWKTAPSSHFDLSKHRAHSQLIALTTLDFIRLCHIATLPPDAPLCGCSAPRSSLKTRCACQM